MSDAPKKRQMTAGDILTAMGHALNNPEEAKAGAKQATKNMLHQFLDDAFEEIEKRPKKKGKPK